MHQPRRLRIIASILLCFVLQAQCADKYTDENRPYEFGFKIDGEQHRHESKDKDGIIMGEFGFITADNVYHVTVYATDKEGRFKILSMKNIHLKSSPESSPGPTSARQGHALALPPPQPASVQAVAAPVPQAPSAPPPFKPISIEPPGRSCSSCSIPTTTKVPPPAFIQVNDNNYNTPNQFGTPGPVSQNQPPFGSSPGQQNYPQPPLGQTLQAPNAPNVPNYAQPLNPPSSLPNAGNRPTYPQGAPAAVQPGGRTSKQYQGPEPQFDARFGSNSAQGPGSSPSGPPSPAKPTLFSAQMQIVDKNTDIHALRPGEKEGLPPGLNKNDMTQLLYTFNYTVGFHGHFEEGYTNGVKKGYYFVTGRNGVRTRIDYVADDSGFHPKVSQEVLDLLSDDVPKPETEKDAKYGLKGYEFKWLYYPVESRRR